MNEKRRFIHSCEAMRPHFLRSFQSGTNWCAYVFTIVPGIIDDKSVFVM